MKFFKLNLWLLVVAVLVMSSCSSDDDSPTPTPIDETQDLKLVKTFTDEQYTVDLFTASGKLEVGYNQLFLRIEDESGDYVQDAKVNWDYLMTMQMGEMVHQHGTPFGELEKTANTQTLYSGYVVFVMASDEPESFWELQLKIDRNSQITELTDRVAVVDTETKYNKRYTSAMGTDDQNYILALVEPQDPTIGSNDMVVALFTDAGHGHFSLVDDYTLRIDPRMPGMGNHSATGNEDLTQGEDGFYHGKVGFSMTGYWKLNLIMEDASGTVLKGEEVTDDNEESSLHFKLEF